MPRGRHFLTLRAGAVGNIRVTRRADTVRNIRVTLSARGEKNIRGHAARLRSAAAAVGMAAAGGGEPDSDDGSEELVLTPLQLIRSLEQVVRSRDERRGFLGTF